MVYNIFQLIILAVLSLKVTSSPIPDSLFNFRNDSISKAATGVYKLNFNIQRGSTLQQSSMGNVAKVVTGAYYSSLTNENTFYLATIQIGTPYQEVGLTIDTGSSDLWVQGTNNPYCEQVDCEEYGTFNSSRSSTYNPLNNLSEFYISYADSTYAVGTWSTENVGFAGMEVTNVQFALANKSTSQMGVFGIGLKTTESASIEYDNFPLQLVNQGFINKNAYSLYLNSVDATQGTILFGGVDKAKYTGSLTPIPLTKDLDGIYSSLSIELANVSYDGNTYKIGSNALVDSGTTLTYLPSDIVYKIASDAGASYNSDAGAYLLDCNITTPVIFEFDGASIAVPMSSLTLPVSTISNENIEGVCALGIFTSSDIILGDNFIRSCYTVFDLDNKTISIAPINYTNEENVQVL